MNFKILIGDNATGKTSYLSARLNSVGKEKAVTNIGRRVYADNDYSLERLKLLEENNTVGLCDIHVGVKSISIKSDEDLDITLSDKFMQVITLLCRKGDFLYLDEPEYELSIPEQIWVYDFIQDISNSFKEIIIATHSNIFYGMTDVEFALVLDGGGLEILTEEETILGYLSKK